MSNISRIPYMDDSSFVRSLFADDGSRTRTDSLFGDQDLFAGYDPLIEMKHENAESFEPLDPTAMSLPITPPMHKASDFAMFPAFHTQMTSSHEFELRVPQLATTSNFNYSYSVQGGYNPQNIHPTHVYAAQPPPQQPPQQPMQLQHAQQAMYHDTMLRANTTIASSPAIQVRKFNPADTDFRKFQLTNHVVPMQRSITTEVKQTTKLPVQRSTTVPTTARDHAELQPSYKSKGKRCTEAGCLRRAQSNNRCKAHGGGARCQHPGCPKSSQGGGFCRAHGGGKKCEFEGCTKGQQRKGFCYAHGGIRKCKHPMCDKKDRGNGFCIAHGGGKRCSMEGCLNAVRKGRYCRAHMDE
ncbi:hypothetical protein LEN26_019423 [Aphanomyces euteiches]|nr:hypothetical protein LEN26_019423 [Aphanomyces euteiches]KAH9125677.1 hypothetical protein AeMF1_003737 [Aphanomyces euteiches]KAH9186473.1 hypothetical protein AeNC1_011552 [Aphanomyces euteiches]